MLSSLQLLTVRSEVDRLNIHSLRMDLSPRTPNARASVSTRAVASWRLAILHVLTACHTITTVSQMVSRICS